MLLPWNVNVRLSSLSRLSSTDSAESARGTEISGLNPEKRTERTLNRKEGATGDFFSDRSSTPPEEFSLLDNCLLVVGHNELLAPRAYAAHATLISSSLTFFLGEGGAGPRS